MKFLFPVLLLAVTFTACKKDYTCECTNSLTNQKEEITLKERRENDASYKCERVTFKPASTVGSYNCKLK